MFAGLSRTSENGTWCERQEPSTLRPPISFGPVQPFGARKTIMGQRGRSAFPLSRAFFQMPRISATIASSVAAIFWCIVSGSDPSTNQGL